MTGRLGFELHPKKLTAEEIAFAKAAVNDYKRIRPVVQRGDLYRLVSPYEYPLSSLMYVSEDKSSAVLFALGLKINGAKTEVLKVRGLDANAKYSVKEINCGKTRHAKELTSITGKELMENGISVTLVGDYDSAVFEINKQK
jgi:alpha-galactosidase